MTQPVNTRPRYPPTPTVLNATHHPAQLSCSPACPLPRDALLALLTRLVLLACRRATCSDAASPPPRPPAPTPSCPMLLPSLPTLPSLDPCPGPWLALPALLAAGDLPCSPSSSCCNFAPTATAPPLLLPTAATLPGPPPAGVAEAGGAGDPGGVAGGATVTIRALPAPGPGPVPGPGVELPLSAAGSVADAVDSGGGSKGLSLLAVACTAAAVAVGGAVAVAAAVVKTVGGEDGGGSLGWEVREADREGGAGPGAEGAAGAEEEERGCPGGRGGRPDGG